MVYGGLVVEDLSINKFSTTTYVKFSRIIIHADSCTQSEQDLRYLRENMSRRYSQIDKNTSIGNLIS